MKRTLDGELLKAMIKGALATTDDELTCDECAERIDHFVELELSGKTAEEALPLVDRHLHACVECREAFEMLRDALNSDR